MSENSTSGSGQYGEKIPWEVKSVIESFHGQEELKYALVVYLIENGQTDFQIVADDLGVEEEELNSAHSDLQTGGLVTKKVGGPTLEVSDSKLEVTEWCKRVLDGFYDAMAPKYADEDGDI